MNLRLTENRLRQVIRGEIRSLSESKTHPGLGHPVTQNEESLLAAAGDILNVYNSRLGDHFMVTSNDHDPEVRDGEFYPHKFSDSMSPYRAKLHKKFMKMGYGIYFKKQQSVLKDKIEEIAGQTGWCDNLERFLKSVSNYLFSRDSPYPDWSELEALDPIGVRERILAMPDLSPFRPRTISAIGRAYRPTAQNWLDLIPEDLKTKAANNLVAHRIKPSVRDIFETLIEDAGMSPDHAREFIVAIWGIRFRPITLQAVIQRTSDNESPLETP